MSEGAQAKKEQIIPCQGDHPLVIFESVGAEALFNIPNTSSAIHRCSGDVSAGRVKGYGVHGLLVTFPLPLESGT